MMENNKQNECKTNPSNNASSNMCRHIFCSGKDYRKQCTYGEPS